MDLPMLRSLPRGQLMHLDTTQFTDILPRAAATIASSKSMSASATTTSAASTATHTITNITVVGPYPFYSSSSALVYVASMCTTLAWFLVIILIIPPGQFMSPPVTRSLPPSVSARPDALISGSRPWLQKVAALLVAISMTIASADILSTVQTEYYKGYIDSTKVVSQVSSSTMIKVFQVISNIFVLLAQVQTLIRLFPRQKEKLIIKWFGFFLIFLDLFFSSLDNFWLRNCGAPVDDSNSATIYPTNCTDTKKQSSLGSPDTTPLGSADAISALSYLFQLALALLYAAWVFYYVGTKRRYAFISPRMPNISLIALLAIFSALIPICFFVVDIAVQNAYGWGDFMRWVGGLAASVVVWEWVERIEALEQDEKKDGILGREVFDEDEVLGRPTNMSAWPDQTRRDSSGGSDGCSSNDPKWQSPSLGHFWHKLRPGTDSQSSIEANLEKQQPHSIYRRRRWPTLANARRPSMAPSNPTPISRTDTTSAVSTEYAVHYHPVTVTPPVKDVARPITPGAAVVPQVDSAELLSNNDIASKDGQALGKKKRVIQFEIPTIKPPARPAWAIVSNPFKRRKESPPLEIKQAMSLNTCDNGDDDNATPTVVPVASRIEAEANESRSTNSNPRTKRPHFRVSSSSRTEPTVIPAPPRGHVWSPNLLSHSPAMPKSESHPSQHSTSSDGNVDSDKTVVNEDGAPPSRLNTSSRSDDEDIPVPTTAGINSRTSGFMLSPADLGERRHSQDEDEHPL